MEQKFNVSYSVTVDTEELFEDFKNDWDISCCDETDVRDYVMGVLEDDNKLRLLNEDDKECIVKEVINLYNNEKPDIPIEVLNAREKLLKAMNDYILEVIGDDDVTDTWLAVGVPDCANEEDFLEIASDVKTWIRVVNNFSRLIKEETY
jgi:hypothetical protein